MFTFAKIVEFFEMTERVSHIGGSSVSRPQNPFRASAQEVEGFDGQRTFVSDFHGTLVNGEGLQADYLKSLINLDRAGHRVVIASGLPNQAHDELQSKELEIKTIADELNLNTVDRSHLSRNLLAVHNKLSLRQEGIKRPDVLCDDVKPAKDEQIKLLTRHYLDPNSEEFDAFVAEAKVSPQNAHQALQLLLSADPKAEKLFDPAHQRICCDFGAAMDDLPNTPLIQYLAMAQKVGHEIVLFKDRGFSDDGFTPDKLEKLDRFLTKYGAKVEDFVVAESSAYAGTKAMLIVSNDPEMLDIDTAKTRRKGGVKESIWPSDSPHILRTLAIVGGATDKMEKKGFPSKEPNDPSLRHASKMLPDGYGGLDEEGSDQIFSGNARDIV